MLFLFCHAEILQEIADLKSSLRLCVINYGLKSVARFVFDCVINLHLLTTD